MNNNHQKLFDLAKETTLLFVDDSLDLKTLMVKILNNFGFQTTFCTNAEDVLEQIKIQNFDIVLTDIKMPGMNGIELITEIKRIFPDQLIIASTAYGDEKTYIKLLNLQISAFLPKPSDLTTIENVLFSVLNNLFIMKEHQNQEENLKELVNERTKKIKVNHLRLKNMEEVLLNSEILTVVFRVKPSYKLLLKTKNQDWFTYSFDDFFRDGFINSEICLNDNFEYQKEEFEEFLLKDSKEITFKIKILENKNREIIWLKLLYHKSFELNGEIEKVQVVFSNITEEEEKNEKIRNLSKIIEQTSTAISIINEDGFIYYYNKSFFNDFKNISSVDSHNELFEMIEFSNDEDRITILNNLFSDNTYDCEIPVIKNEVEKWYKLTILPLKNEQNYSEKKYAIFLDDITSHKLNQLKLIKNEEKYRRIFSNIHDVYLEFDTNGKVIEVSPSVKNVLGFNKNEIIGRMFSMMFSTLKDYDKMMSILRSEKKINQFETTIKAKNRTISAAISTKLTTYPDATEGVYTVTLRDVSEKKMYEHNLLDMNKDLLKKNKEMKKMQTQLVQQEKMASIGQLAAGIAHEINNPTGYIMSNFRTFKDYIKDITDYLETEKELIAELEEKEISDLEKLGELKELAEEIDIEFILEDLPGMISESISGTNKIKDIVQNLKNFARQDLVDEVKEANVNDILEEGLKLVWNELKYSCKVEKNLGDIPDVKCYPNQLNQVFTNMFVNASHAIKDRYSEEMGTIKIETFNQTDSVVVMITDNGKGITKENLKNIYDPFFTTKEVGKGTGLGLNISYDIIVNKHKGKITCESVENDHTTFIMEIPKEMK